MSLQKALTSYTGFLTAEPRTRGAIGLSDGAEKIPRTSSSFLGDAGAIYLIHSLRLIESYSVTSTRLDGVKDTPARWTIQFTGTDRQLRSKHINCKL